MMQKFIKHLRSELAKHFDEQHKIGSQRFFKEPLKLYGIKAPILHIQWLSATKKYTSSTKMFK